MIKPIIQSEHDADNRVERTIRDIRLHIADKGLQPGDIMPSESAMATQLKVSRTVMREAFRALAALRILEIGNGRRARVAAPDAEAFSMILDHTVHTKQLSIQQVLDVRRTLELRTASLAALRRSDDEARDLLKTTDQMMAAIDDANAVKELDISFHEKVARASGNSLYAIIISSFRVITQQTWEIGWRSRGTLQNREANIRCHEEIAVAISMQDPTRAEAAMSKHFDSAVGILLNAGVT